MPATSPGLESITSQLKPCAAPQRRYMRSSICAQSWASVPPAPAWMSRNALCASISPRNMRRSSRRRTCSSNCWASPSISRAAVSSPSLTASSSSSPASPMPAVARSISATSALKRARSRPSSWARAGFDHTAGSSSSRATSSSRSCLRSYSKKPPERAHAIGKILELASELIDFHTIPDGTRQRDGAAAVAKPLDASTAARTLASVARIIRGQQMVDEQLQAALALVLVHFQAVHELHRSLGRCERDTLFQMIEGDGIEAAAAARHFDPHLQVPVADDACAAHAEQAVKARLGEGLAPRPARAQGLRGREGDLRGR